MKIMMMCMWRCRRMRNVLISMSLLLFFVVEDASGVCLLLLCCCWTVFLFLMAVIVMRRRTGMKDLCLEIGENMRLVNDF